VSDGVSPSPKGKPKPAAPPSKSATGLKKQHKRLLSNHSAKLVQHEQVLHFNIIATGNLIRLYVIHTAFVLSYWCIQISLCAQIVMPLLRRRNC